jgi:hypothetical protein
MHFLFNLSRVNDLCMFRTLLAHTQEVLHKRRLVYCVRLISVGCLRVKVENLTLVAGTCECGNEPAGSIKCGEFLD